MTRTITNLCYRNQENFVKRLINAESHFVQEGASLVDAVNRAHESREKYQNVKNNNKRFHDQGMPISLYHLTKPAERDNQISKENAMLIKNLLEISHGKRVSDR